MTSYTYRTCLKCGRPMRSSSKAKANEEPGLVGYGARGLCASHYQEVVRQERREAAKSHKKREAAFVRAPMVLDPNRDLTVAEQGALYVVLRNLKGEECERVASMLGLS